MVYTRASSGQAVYYINGVQVSSRPTGNFSTWGTDQKLTLADDWRGDYFLLAVYGRALTGSRSAAELPGGRERELRKTPLLSSPRAVPPGPPPGERDPPPGGSS